MPSEKIKMQHSTQTPFSDFYGYAAIMLWSFSAMFIAWTPDVPPFLLACLTSASGFLLFAGSWVKNPQKILGVFKQPFQVLILFFLAVVVYRGLYLSGLKLAPIIEANLLNYLWPLLIIILGTGFDKTKLSPQLLIGAISCFLGVIFIGLHKSGGDITMHFEIGHILAALAAFTWASYSVLTRRYPAAPIDVIGSMHFLAAIVFMILHIYFEPPKNLASLDFWHWAGIAGLAFAISLGYGWWDKAMTHGNREKLAVAAYFTPLLSTLWLILFTGQEMTGYVYAAAILILGGSLLARIKQGNKK